MTGQAKLMDRPVYYRQEERKFFAIMYAGTCTSRNPGTLLSTACRWPFSAGTETGTSSRCRRQRPRLSGAQPPQAAGLLVFWPPPLECLYTPTLPPEPSCVWPVDMTACRALFQLWSNSGQLCLALVQLCSPRSSDSPLDLDFDLFFLF